MNKLIIFLSIFFAMGCVNKIEYSDTQIVSLINHTGNDLRYYFESSFGTDSLFSNGNDSVFFTNTERKMVEKGILGVDRNRVFSPHILFVEEIYDLTDTMSYILSKEANNYLTRRDSIYIDHIENNIIQEGYIDYRINYRVIYNWDIITTIMQKDYTMLNRFKDYYGR